MGLNYNPIYIIFIIYIILILHINYINSYLGIYCNFNNYKLFGKKNRIVSTDIASGKQEQRPIRHKSYGTYIKVYGNPNFKNYEDAIKSFRAKIAMSGREEIFDSKPDRYIPRHMILRRLRQSRGFKISSFQRKRSIIRATSIKDENNIRNVYYRQLPIILNALNSYQEFLNKNHNGSESFIVNRVAKTKS